MDCPNCTRPGFNGQDCDGCDYQQPASIGAAAAEGQAVIAVAPSNAGLANAVAGGVLMALGIATGLFGAAVAGATGGNPLNLYSFLGIALVVLGVLARRKACGKRLLLQSRGPRNRLFSVGQRLQLHE